MGWSVLSEWIVSSLLLGLRVAPVFALAPPFTLVRLPLLFRVALGLGVSACLISIVPPEGRVSGLAWGPLAVSAARELMLGATFVLAFQLVFGALYFAGRTVDIQAGFGLAGVIDPTTLNNMPLVGTLFAYAFAAVFFGMGGQGELLRIMADSLRTVPLGEATTPASLAHLAAFISAVFLVSLGVAGGAILCLFLTDMAVAFLARTAPQLNALVLGFQLKTMLLLLVLATTFGFAGVQLARLARITLEGLPGLIR